MDLLKRTISLILVFQLCWACNGSGGASGVVSTGGSSSSSSTLTISGTIAGISSIIFSSAHAATGDLNIYDITNPDSPILLHTETLAGVSTFSAKLKKSDLADGKILKAEFISSESGDLSRTLLLDVAGTEKTVSATLNEESNLNSQMLESQLELERNQGISTSADFKTRFKAIKSEDTTELTSSLGDKALLAKLMSNQDPGVRRELGYILGYIKQAKANGDEQQARELKYKLFDYAQNNGYFKNDVAFNCLGNQVTLLFRNQSFRIYAKPNDLEAIQKWGSPVMDFGVVGDANQANDLIQKALNTLEDVNKATGKNVSAMLYIESVDGPAIAKSCRIFGEAMTSTEVANAALPIYPVQINKTAINALKFADVVDEIDAMKQLVVLYYETLKQFREAVKNAGLDPDVAQQTYMAGVNAANGLVEARVIEFFNHFRPLTNPASSYSFNLKMLQNVLFELYQDPAEAQKNLDFSLSRAIDDLQMRVDADGVDRVVEQIDTKIDLGKIMLEVRREEANWYFANPQL